MLIHSIVGTSAGWLVHRPVGTAAVNRRKQEKIRGVHCYDGLCMGSGGNRSVRKRIFESFQSNFLLKIPKMHIFDFITKETSKPCVKS